MPKLYKYSARGYFRTEKPKLGRVKGGWQWLQGCGEWVGGRWEGFVSFRSPVFKVRSEAMKHMPRW